MGGHGKIRGSIGVFIGILLFPVFAQLTAGQETNQTTIKKSEDFQRKKWSLQFKIDENFTLSAFQGALISCQRQLSDRSALRLGFGSVSSDFHNDGENTIFENNQNRIDGDNNRDGNSIRLNTALLYIRHLNPRSKVSAYYGIGPNLAWMLEDVKTTSRDYDDSGHVVRTDRYISHRAFFNAGILNVLGVEWFLSKNISLTAEYGLLFIYYWGNTKSIHQYIDTAIEEETNYKSSGFSIDNAPVKFGLSAYF